MNGSTWGPPLLNGGSGPAEASTDQISKMFKCATAAMDVGDKVVPELLSKLAARMRATSDQVFGGWWCTQTARECSPSNGPYNL